MDPVGLLERRRQQIEELCRAYHVLRLSVFGSAVAGDWNDETSDFDFLVEYLPESRSLPPLDRLVGLQLDLERLLGRKVDVVDWGAARNPYFRDHAQSQARVFYAT